MPGVKRMSNQNGVHERHEKEGGGKGGWVVARGANDTFLGNFNFAEITVELIRIKRSPWKLTLSPSFSIFLFLSVFLSLFLFFPFPSGCSPVCSRFRYLFLSLSRPVEQNTASASSDIK